MVMKLIVGCVLLMMLTSCAVTKGSQIVAAAKASNLPESKHLNGPQACSVLESYINRSLTTEMDGEKWESDIRHPRFVFHGKYTHRNTDCIFTDGSEMTWQEMRDANISRVCFTPDYSSARLLVLPSFDELEEYYFRRTQEEWQLIGKTASDYVLIDGGYETAKRGHKSNSYASCSH